MRELSQSRKVTCPIDKKIKTVYLRVITDGDKQLTASNGCDDLHEDPRCHECTAKEFKITVPSPAQDSQ